MLRLALLLISGAGWAQPSGTVEADAPSQLHENATLRLRYGVSLRSGAQQDIGPGVAYDGLSPNDVSVAASWFPLRALGLSLSAQREGFNLLEGEARVTGGSLIRAAGGPTARLVLGPLKVEALVGYQYAQLPLFELGQPNLRPAQRQGVLLASRIAVGLPAGIVADARGEYTVPLSTTDADGAHARSTGYSAGGGLSFPVYSTDSTDWRLGVDYQYVRDEVVTDSGATSTQTLGRVGAAIQLDFLPAGVPRPPKFGGLTVLVLEEGSGQPLGAAALVLQHEGEERPLTLDAEGRASLEGLKPGVVVARATAGGYLPAHGEAQVVAGEVASLELRVKKEPPKVGGLLIKVTDKKTGAPVAGATVRLRDVLQNQELQTDAAGVVTAAALAPGNVSVTVAAEGYRSGDEVAQVLVGKTFELPVSLVKERQKVQGSVSGIVRSTRGGAPIRARLQIPELKIDLRADASGAFAVTVPAGTFRVIISAPGYRQQTKQVTTREGDQTIFNVDLHPRGR